MTQIVMNTEKPLDYDWLNKELSKTKSKLFTMKGAGYLGSLMCDHEFAWDEDCTTAWCNGTTVAFNPYFFRDHLTPQTRITVLAHELWHTGCDHMGRIGDFDPDLWNVSADHFINLMLEKDGYSFKGIEFACKDPRFNNMSTEQIYAIVAQEMQQDPSGLSGDIKPMPSGSQKTDVIRKLVKAQQVSQMSGEIGVIPEEITYQIQQFLNPALPWDILLQKYFRELSTDDYSWRHPSRRYEDEYLPSKSGDNGLEHIIWYWDISGSMTDPQIDRLNAEARYVFDTFNPKRMTVVTFDTKIHDIFEFTEGDSFENLEIHGRGGTSLDPVYHHIKEHQPTAAIIMSDLYCYPMESNPGSSVLWVVIDNPSAKTYFGKTIHLHISDI